MPVTFKLVGSINTNILEIKKQMVGQFRLSHFQALFEAYGLTKEEIENLKFVANSESIKDNDKVFTITNEDSIIIFVFSSIKEIRDKLTEIFKENNTNQEKISETKSSSIQIVSEEVDSNLTKKIYEDETEKVPVLDDETVAEINAKNVKLFQSENFKNLVKIYYNDQDIFKTFFSFITSGNIVNFDIPDSAKTKDYQQEILIIRSLGIEESDEEIKTCLIAFNGHINLAIRALLLRGTMEVTK